MSDINQLNFVKNNIHKIHTPILETGSKDYVNTQNFRSLFTNYKYIGVDMESGKGVDVMVDLTENFELVNQRLNGERFKTIFCFSVLEHCVNPFKMGDNITKLLAKKGLVFISVPFSWRIHNYPSDYWRFTSDGIKALFPGLQFNDDDIYISTSDIGEMKPIDDYMFRADLSITKGWKRKDLFGVLFGVFRKLKILPKRFNYSYLFPPVNINMIGKKI